MIRTAYGTLESTGPNASGETDCPCSILNYNSIGANASTHPDTSGSLASAGPNGAYGTTAAPLVNAVDPSNDTTMHAVPGGTLEATLDIWRR